MKLVHISDTHGSFPTLPEDIQVVVHSGDFMPDCPMFGMSMFHRPMPDGVASFRYQRNWISHHKKQLRKWLDGRIFLLCRGNHDFYDPCNDLRRIGVDARTLCEGTIQEVGGVRFIGFEYIPVTGGGWANELGIQAMSEEVQKIVDVFDRNEADVLVAHCPPYGILDMSGERRFGNTGLIDALNYKFRRLPKAILCGHIHENHGEFDFEGVLISNAATVQRVVEV